MEEGDRLTKFFKLSVRAWGKMSRSFTVTLLGSKGVSGELASWIMRAWFMDMICWPIIIINGTMAGRSREMGHLVKGIQQMICGGLEGSR